MANIIRTGGGVSELTGNATASDVISGKTFYSNDPDNKQTRTLTLSGNAQASDVLSGKTFYNDDPKAKQTGTLSLSGNATPADVAAGKTFYNTDAKTKQTGTYNPNIPTGYILKTGSLALSSLNGSTYIPIGIKFDFSADDWDGSKPKANLYDNLGTKLGQMQAPFGGWGWYIDLYSVYGGNIEKLKQWRNLSSWQGSHGNWFRTSNVTVVTWLQLQ